MNRPCIFVSAVSPELRTARREVSATIRTLGYDPVSQDDFPTGSGELRAWLRKQIDASDGLIQLVGRSYGAEPPEPDATFGRVSYTQWEFLYAQSQAKETWLVVLDEDYPRDTPLDQLDLPEDDQLEPTRYQHERQAIQAAYIERLFQQNHLRHTARTATELQDVILRIRDDLAERREEEKRRQEQVETTQRRRWTSLMVAIVLGVALVLGSIWLLSGQAPELGTTEIRAHLIEEVEEAYRGELTEAEAANSWQERERLREAASVARNNRLSRIDTIVNSISELAGTSGATDVFTEMNRVLREEGVDEAIAYVASQRPSILERVRSRREAERARSRADMQPLLQTAALYETSGKNDAARELYEAILAEDAGWPKALHEFFWFLAVQGDEARVRGSLPDAVRDYRRAHELAQNLVEQNPRSAQWQRELSVSHIKIGDVLRAQGDGPGALAAYQQSLEIFEALVQKDPSSAEWQRDLAVSHGKIGNVLRAQGDGPGALSAYQQSLEIFEALVQKDPSSAEWQRDLSVSHDKIGDVLRAQGDGPGALNAYQQSLEIAKALVEQDPSSAEWQRDLSVSHNKIGDVLRAQGDGPGALNAYQQSLEIRKALVEQDPSSAQWQRDLSVSHEQRIGDVLRAQGDGPGALNAYQQSLEIAKALVEQDPSSAEWQRDLSVSHDRIGDMLRAQGDGPGALNAYQQSLEIRKALVEQDPSSAEWQRDLSVSTTRLATC